MNRHIDMFLELGKVRISSLATISMIKWRSLGVGMRRVGLILAGLLPGWKYQRLPVPADKRKTVPYGVAIMFGSLIALILFSG